MPYPIASPDGVVHLGASSSSRSKLEKSAPLQSNLTPPPAATTINLSDGNKNKFDSSNSIPKTKINRNAIDEKNNDADVGIKRVRFGICLLALLGFALGMMSRLILNVSIVEMVRQRPLVVEGEVVEDEDSTLISIDELGTPFPNINETIDVTELPAVAGNISDFENSTSTNETEVDIADNEPTLEELAGLRFRWTKKEVNMVLGAFYMGYVPGILTAGSITHRFGAKYPIFVAVFGSALINLLTPTIARLSVHLLIASRVLLGSIQGSLTPCMYDLFSKWLTATESSIFAPMIKVSMPMGALIGTLMPGIMSTFGFNWPTLFYLGGSFCLIWSVLWFYFATSTPQENRFVEPNELRQIMRKKTPILAAVKKTSVETVSIGCNQVKSQLVISSSSSSSKSSEVPWLEIMTNKSVLALTLVKLTYNACMDLLYLELALYLREIHEASIETISAIASGTYCIQLVMITFVAWLAKSTVNRRLFGLSKTKWRKIFQGGSNFCMALAYFALPFFSDCLELAAALILAAAFFWMFGAGGESMLPYDLSINHPASIVSLTHSVSKFSGLTIPIVCQLVLGEDTDDPFRWGLLFYLVGGFATLGGLVFVLVVKAKPFLAEEVSPRYQPVDTPEPTTTANRLESIEED